MRAAQEMGELYHDDNFKCSGKREDGKFAHYCSDPALIAESMRQVCTHVNFLKTTALIADTCLCVCMCVVLDVFVRVCVCVHGCMCMCAWLYVYVFMGVCVSWKSEHIIDIIECVLYR